MIYELKIRIILVAVFLGFTARAGAQSIWDFAHLTQVKAQLDKPAYAAAYSQLMDEDRQQLSKEPLSVMMKEATPASGDKHDYMSLSRYFWPDPSKPDGLPYISRDGISNPELEKLDRPKLSSMAMAVTTLSLAWYFSDDEKYAQKATELIHVWFLDKSTRMNPNLNYAQIVPGKYDGKGRCYGVIDGYSLVEMLDAVQLLERSRSFTPKDSKALKSWFSKLLKWLLTSPQGIEEGRPADSVRNNVAFRERRGDADGARRRAGLVCAAHKAGRTLLAVADRERSDLRRIHPRRRRGHDDNYAVINFRKEQDNEQIRIFRTFPFRGHSFARRRDRTGDCPPAVALVDGHQGRIQDFRGRRGASRKHRRDGVQRQR